MKCTVSGWLEATLKPGARHIYKKRVFYIDEDSWQAYDDRSCTITVTSCIAWDGSEGVFNYDVQAPTTSQNGYTKDLVTGIYCTPVVRCGERGGYKYITRRT